MAMIPIFTEPHFENICRAVGHAITGADVTNYHAEVGAPDSMQGGTKWRRLHQDLGEKQRQDRCGNNVVHFIQKSCNPSRFTKDEEKFHTFLSEINQVLSFIGYEYTDKGELRKAKKVETITEAKERHSTLMTEIRRRNIHPHLHQFCREEFLQENYFHAVLEATKSINQRIRDLTGLTQDGEDLYNAALVFRFTREESRPPRLALSFLNTASERSEQKGFHQLLKGISQTFRNPAAHDPKIMWGMKKEDAVDIFTTVSLIHRKLDNATAIPAQT